MFDFTAPVQKPETIAPVPMDTYDVLRAAFDFFNRELFFNKLSPCLIILHRHRTAYGYFHASHMAATVDAKFPWNKQDAVHEIALNPMHIRVRKPKETLATLVHEMVHQQQQELGKPPKNVYHNRQWAAMMKEVGLHPSDTGKVGGAETGRYVSHYVIADGPFDMAFDAFEKQQKLSLFGDLPNPIVKKTRTSKFKFYCPDCDQVCWAKEGASLICGECETPMELT